MTSIKSASGKELRGIQRWRCGACLFQLPEHVEPSWFDQLWDHEFHPTVVLVSGAWSFYNVKISKVTSSIRRGCPSCRILWTQIIRIDDFPTANLISWTPGSVRLCDMNMQSITSSCIFIRGRSSSLAGSVSFHPYIDTRGCPSGDTSSSEAFTEAASWLDQCLSGHGNCARASKHGFMPKRVLEIQNPVLPVVRLISNADECSPQPYVCLSHRWLPETKAACLTKARARTYERGIPRNRLYPLLLDAIQTTYRLGYQFIWIDCLCIYQDDLHDWHSQASNMSDIYENAVLTISALSCDNKSANRRLFSQQLPQKPQKSGIFNGQEVFFNFNNDDDKHPFGVDIIQLSPRTYPSQVFPLTQRGWVFQERLLSRRILHFGKHELIWECNETLWCECRYKESL
jgi:hypothetical protein